MLANNLINSAFLTTLQNINTEAELRINKNCLGANEQDIAKIKSMTAKEVLDVSRYPLIMVRLDEKTLISEMKRVKESFQLTTHNIESDNVHRFSQLFMQCLQAEIAKSKLSASIVFCLSKETIDEFCSLNPIEIINLANSTCLTFKKTRAFPKLTANVSENSVQKTRRLVTSLTEIRKNIASDIKSAIA